MLNELWNLTCGNKMFRLVLLVLQVTNTKSGSNSSNRKKFNDSPFNMNLRDASTSKNHLFNTVIQGR